MKFELDVHTHTIASGHAYGTITEMAKAASEKGLKLLGITEHTHAMPGTCDDIYFQNLRVVQRELFGVRLMLGAELNIMDYEGHVDLSKEIISRLDLCIASIHLNIYRSGTVEQNTQAMIKAMRTPGVDIIGHPDDGNCPVDYEKLVLASKEYHALLEVNNNSPRLPYRLNSKENIITMLKLCEKYDVPVVLNSDAHFMTDIANADHTLPILEEAGFPKELVMNYSAEKFEAYIAWNREHKI